MRRGLLQDYGNTACQMFVGWRSFDDMPRLLAVGTGTGTGTVEIDMLTAETRIGEQPVEPLGISHEINLWLLERLAAEGVDRQRLEAARLTVDVVAQDAPGRMAGVTLRRLRFDCRSTLSFEGRTYLGVLVDEHVGTKKDDGPWVMY